MKPDRSERTIRLKDAETAEGNLLKSLCGLCVSAVKLVYSYLDVSTGSRFAARRAGA
jgi:hypothetical protein